MTLPSSASKMIATLSALPFFEVAVEAVVGDVQLAVVEPLVERRVRLVERLGERLVPQQRLAREAAPRSPRSRARPRRTAASKAAMPERSPARRTRGAAGRRGFRAGPIRSLTTWSAPPADVAASGVRRASRSAVYQRSNARAAPARRDSRRRVGSAMAAMRAHGSELAVAMLNFMLRRRSPHPPCRIPHDPIRS